MTPSTRMLTVSLFASIALFTSACDGPSGIFTDVERADPSGPVADPIAEQAMDPSSGHVQVPNRSDLGQPAEHQIDELVSDPGSNMIRVQFTAQAGECTIHQANAIETAESVEVTLFQGLHPNVAAMACMNVQEQQEILLALKAPLGSRLLKVMATPSTGPSDAVDPGDSDAIDAASYVEMLLVDATDRAQNAGLQWRVTRDGDEFFGGTADYRTDRINFEVDDGVVTTATIG